MLARLERRLPILRGGAVDAPERQRTIEALYRYFDPLRGGPEGDGWAFGRPILLGEVFGVAQRVDGVDLIEDARMFPADPISGQRGEAITRIDQYCTNTFGT